MNLFQRKICELYDVNLLESGLLALGDYDIEECDKVSVMVHALSRANDQLNPDFEEKRDKFLQTYSGPVVLGIGGKNISDYSEQLDWLESLDHAGPRFIYLTSSQRPLPMDPDLGSLIVALKGFKAPLRIFGAQVVYNFNYELNETMGCVNQTYKYFMDIFDCTIDLDLCWHQKTLYPGKSVGIEFKTRGEKRC